MMRPTTLSKKLSLVLIPTGLLTLVVMAGGLTIQDESPTPTTAEPPSTWEVDSTHSAAMFRIEHLGAGAFWGRFNSPSGQVIWDHTGQACPEFDITIPISSIDSGNDNLDTHLRSPDFFNEPEFPNMTFTSTGCTPSGENRWDMTGQLTLLGQTKPITVKLERIGTADKGRGLRSGFEATFTITRSDHGMTWGVNRGALGDKVQVIVAIETIKK